MPSAIHTPCIGICSTTYGGDVCRGCKRFAHEVINWNRYDDQQKELVWARLSRLTEEVVATRLTVSDADLLAQALRRLGVRFHADRSPAFAAMELLRALGRQHADLAACGLSPLPGCGHLSPADLYRELNEDLLARAEAWFDLHHGRARRLFSGL